MIRKPRQTGRLLASAGALALCAPTLAAAPAHRSPGVETPASAQRCPAPGNWRIVSDPDERFRAISNALTVDRHGRIFWNNEPIDVGTLQTYLGLVATMRPVPRLLVEIDPATPCEQAARIAEMAAAAVDCSRLCSHAVLPWRHVRLDKVAPPAPPAPQFRPVKGKAPAFRPVPPPSAPPAIFRPVPAPPPPPPPPPPR